MREIRVSSMKEWMEVISYCLSYGLDFRAFMDAGDYVVKFK